MQSNPRPVRGFGVAGGEDAHVGLAAERHEGRRIDLGGRDHLDELASQDGRRRGFVEGPVDGDDAPEGGGRIGLVGAIVGLPERRPERHATGVRVLDDHAHRVREGEGAIEGRVGIGDVVVGQRLALEHARRRHAPLRGRRLDIEGPVLVGVLAIAQVLALLEIQVQARRKFYDVWGYDVWGPVSPARAPR